MAKRNYVVYKYVSSRKSNNKPDIPSDVLGSYTGLTKDGEKPVQDADDL